jgi:hypothetical protein
MDYEHLETTIDDTFHVIVAFRWSGKPNLEHHDGERLEKEHANIINKSICIKQKILFLLCSPLISSMYSKLLT